MLPRDTKQGRWFVTDAYPVQDHRVMLQFQIPNLNLNLQADSIIGGGRYCIAAGIRRNWARQPRGDRRLGGSS